MSRPEDLGEGGEFVAGSGAGTSGVGTGASVAKPPEPGFVGSSQSSRLPGAPRRDYHHITGPVPLTGTVLSGPSDPSQQNSDPAAGGWQPAIESRHRPAKKLAGTALTIAIFALLFSFFVAWALPVAVLAVILALVALTRSSESRTLAVWALVLGAVALSYSIGWLIWMINELVP